MKLIANLLVMVVLSQLSLSTQHDTECTTPVCTQQIGYVNYRSGVGSLNYRGIRPSVNQYTSIVVVVKNIKMPSLHGNLSPVSVSFSQYTFSGILFQTKVHQLSGTKDTVFVFERTNLLYVFFNLQVSSVRLEFFVGCAVVLGRHPNITKKAELQQQNFAGQYPWSLLQIIQHAQPKCWIVIPTITTTIKLQQLDLYTRQFITKEKKVYHDVKRSYLTFQNVTTENAAINVINLLTGATILSVQGNVSKKISSLDSNSTHIQCKTEGEDAYNASNILCVELHCNSTEDCNAAEFSFSNYALEQSDLDCIERENKCQFNIGDSDVNCTKEPPIFALAALYESTEYSLSNTACPAYQDFLTLSGLTDSQATGNKETVRHHLIITKFEKELHLYSINHLLCIESEGDGGRSAPQFLKTLASCGFTKKICEDGICGDIESEGCRKICYLFKLRHGLCEYFASRYLG